MLSFRVSVCARLLLSYNSLYSTPQAVIHHDMASANLEMPQVSMKDANVDRL